jgi:hypothetical protein
MQAMFKAMFLTSPHCGMGRYWYPKEWYMPRNWRRGYLRAKLGVFDHEAGSWPPLVAKRDRHDPLQYKGRTQARTIWNVQAWTE